MLVPNRIGHHYDRSANGSLLQLQFLHDVLPLLSLGCIALSLANEKRPCDFLLLQLSFDARKERECETLAADGECVCFVGCLCALSCIQSHTRTTAHNDPQFGMRDLHRCSSVHEIDAL
jgi:hypothetical protein